MKLYDRNGNIYTYSTNKNNRISNGTQGVVYNIDDDKCLKVYHKNNWLYVEEELFDKLKELNLKQIVTLYDILYDNNKNDLGYTMKYYKKIDGNALYLSSDYFIDNFELLYQTIIYLAEERIKVNDLHRDNVILSNDTITLIDIDSYLLVKDYLITYEEILDNNIRKLLSLFQSIFREELTKLNMSPIYNSKLFNYIEYLFSSKANPCKNMTRELKQCDKPIDLLINKTI